jgi:predicted dehydrogenase
MCGMSQISTLRNTQMIRIGIVGAGANTRLRHLPGFAAIDGVDVIGVVNRTTESTQKIAEEYSIPKTYATWQELVADDDVDAVMIGTWPNMHCEITCAALQAGKHVLTEARMSRDLEEARRMFAASNERPDLVAQIVPSPFGLEHHAAVVRLINDGYLGEIREAAVIGADSSFHDANQPLHWRQNKSISGNNILAMGIMHETLVRWCPHPTRVFAQTQLFEPFRAGDNGKAEVTVPDSLQIATQFEQNEITGQGVYHLSGIALHGPAKQIHLYGSEGTIKITLGAKEEVWMGSRSDAQLARLNLVDHERGGWRVEEEFIQAIRGKEAVQITSFEDGVKYMQFTEAVTISSGENRVVDMATL